MKISERILDIPVPLGFEFNDLYYKTEDGLELLQYTEFGGVIQMSKEQFEKMAEQFERWSNLNFEFELLRESNRDLRHENKVYKDKYGELSVGMDDEILLSGRPGKLTDEHKKFIRLHLYDMTSGNIYKRLRSLYGYEGKKQTVANFCSRLKRAEKEREQEMRDKELGMDWSEMDFELFSQEPFAEFSEEIKKAIRKMYSFDKVRDKAVVGLRIADKYGVSASEVEVYIEMFEKGAGWL